MFSPAQKKAIFDAAIIFGNTPSWARHIVNNAERAGYVSATNQPDRPNHEAKRAAIAKLRLLDIEVRGWNDN